MGNTIKLPRGTAAPASLSKSELAIRHIAANATAASSSMLYIGEDAGDDGVTVRALGTGMTGDSGQGGATVGGTMTFTGGTDITTSVSGSTVTITSSAGGGSGDITAVVAGTGLSGGATSGSATLNVDAAQTQITSVGTIGTGVWEGTAIANSFIANDAITNNKIADNSINSEHYVDGSIDNAHIADDAINSEHYYALSIDGAHIANDAITNNKIADNTIDSEHYVDGSIDNAHIADDAVDTEHLADDCITATQIDDGAVSFAHLKASTVQLSSESFVDNDASIMTSAAIQDKILAYGYSTATGDITAVSAGSGMSGGGASGNVTLTNSGVTSIVAGNYVSISGATGAVTVTSQDTTYSVGDGGLTSNNFTDADHSKLDGIAASATANIGDITGVTAGTGMSGGGSSGSVTLTNSGVTSAVAGSGIDVSGATGAVTISIGTGEVVNAMIGDNEVNSEHYADGSIDNAHIADDAINSEHYADGSIDLAHMSSQSVDEDNLYISNSGSNGQFLSKQSGNSGGLTWAAAGGAAADDITAGDAAVSIATSSGNVVIGQTAALTVNTSGDLQSGTNFLQVHHLGLSNLDSGSATYGSWCSTNGNQSDVFQHRGLQIIKGKVIGAICTCDSALSAGFSGMTCTLTGSTTGGISDQTYNDGPARAFESATTGELTDLINYEWEASDVIKLTMTPGTGSDSRAIVALLIQWEY